MGVSRRQILQAPATAAPLLAQRSGPRGARPNFVFLISDDQSYPDLGCLGRPVETPNLDRLAGQGMRFDSCYVSSAQCSPNRSSILTGCTPHTTATSRLHTPLPDWEPTIVDYLKEAGYYCGAFRKVHQGAPFDKRWDFYGNAQKPFAAFFDELPADKPFFLHVGFTDPHRPYKRGSYPAKHDPARVFVPAYLPDTPKVREDIADYYDAIARMDQDTGEVLRLLEDRGLAGNTLLIFTGDNGMPFPGAKGTCYEPGIRVPMLVRWPARIRSASTRPELIAHVDFAPTWLDAAGIPIPPKMQGRSFLPVLLGSGLYRPRDAVFVERNWHDNFDPIRAVRTRRHKLIFNAMPHLPYRPSDDLRNSLSWESYLEQANAGKLPPVHYRLLEPARPLLELYDLERDPDEFDNRVTDPAYREVLDDLKQRLGNWMHDTYDYLPPAGPRPGQPAGRGWPLSL